jgi:DNA-binding protein YbaB
MRQKLTKQEIRAVQSLDDRIRRMAEKMEENDVELHYGNGSVESQLNCAAAALECILQENRED